MSRSLRKPEAVTSPWILVGNLNTTRRHHSLLVTLAHGGLRRGNVPDNAGADLHAKENDPGT